MVDLNVVDIQLLGCVEESIEKLHISGQIMPLTYEMRNNAKQLLNQNLNNIKETQNEAESEFQNALAKKDGVGNAGKNLKAATHAFQRSLKQNPLGNDVFEKIELDRMFLENILQELTMEIGSKSFDKLKSNVAMEKKNKSEFQEIIKREQESRQIIKDLQKSLVDIKIEKEVEIQKRNELIAHLKDRLQELKAKTNMEAKYVKKSTDNSVAQTKKKCDLSEVELKQQIENVQEQIDEENRCNAELESYLKGAIGKMKQLTEHWNEKSEKETAQKQIDLDKLKASRAKDLERYQALAKTFSEYEKVAVADRLDKDQEKKRLEQERFELLASIKIQAWWRSQMLRHNLGPNKKKKKGKKGKKGKKK